MDHRAQILETIYGEFSITEPILIDLLASHAMQRLKKINQFGVSQYIDKTMGTYTRYAHSVGVFVLLRRYGLGLEEQIAGLLHDASHTVFSHVGDYLFNGEHESGSSYQDQIHQWYLERTDVAQIVQKYGYQLTQLLHKSGKFRALEQDLPDLCADRIEYTLHEAVLRQGIKTTQAATAWVENILRHLHFENGIWFFDSLSSAREYADLALKFTQQSWASDCAMYTATIAAQMLRRALQIGVLDYNIIHFGVDDDVWHKLKDCRDQEIQDCLDKICHYTNAYRLSNVQDYNMHLRGKFRGVDPYVKCGLDLQRLSKLDHQFAQNFALLKAHTLAGIYIKSLV